ncbi:helix-turn-helix domain-containing protein [Autumnicola edwardsiae]|jgi:predicted RNase H-like HicB family nuclease|uniref:Helix-turn-helix transcriptional regulator n=1 Tax=Autumnicola edwardsiae TaxID=3075594 RepID=A0ABU3CS59_9FLAO|nr:helix-turn-helix transcriptional regulator [Zunongwangia sp. F297]MDT0649185.1 helix-turn-helix transcriptional regulator [Zunongwangia sp. F297]
MTKKKKIIMTVEKTDTGFSAFSNEYPIFTTGQSIPELINNTYEATGFYFEEEKVKVEPNDIKFEIDFQQFFKYYKVINAKFLAEKIGMNTTLLSQYVSGTKKPSAKQTEKILNGIHQIGQELSGINLLQTA